MRIEGVWTMSVGEEKECSRTFELEYVEQLLKGFGLVC
jgi:hypothetical protein